jgi:hypothetical protein
MQLGFLLVGHTHEDKDGNFGYQVLKYWNSMIIIS